MRSLPVLPHVLTFHHKANFNIRCTCIPVSACRHKWSLVTLGGFRLTYWDLDVSYTSVANGCVLFLLRSSFFILPAQPQDIVSYSFPLSYTSVCKTDVSCFSCVLLYTGAFTCACILFFYGSSFFFFCQPYNLMYLRAALIDFNETWSQW